MSVQSANMYSIYISPCPIVISNSDNILTYQSSFTMISSRNINATTGNCFPTDAKLAYVYNKDQLNICCGNILNKRTVV